MYAFGLDSSPVGHLDSRRQKTTPDSRRDGGAISFSSSICEIYDLPSYLEIADRGDRIQQEDSEKMSKPAAEDSVGCYYSDRSRKVTPPTMRLQDKVNADKSYTLPIVSTSAYSQMLHKT